MSLFLVPFIWVVKIIFHGFMALLNNPGVAVLFLSVVLALILLPLFYVIEKVKLQQQSVVSNMKAEIDEMRSAYKGGVLYCYIREIYKIHNYNQFAALLPSLGLLVQIPFLLAAYYYLSGYAGFIGTQFLYIKDLSQPDTIAKIWGMPINFLPFLMTAVNVWSGWLYGKDGKRSERIQYLAVALLFLVLLYNAAASVLLYWTLSNILAVGRIIFLKKSVKVVPIAVVSGEQDVTKLNTVKSWPAYIFWSVIPALFFVMTIGLAATELYLANIADYGTQLSSIIALATTLLLAVFLGLAVLLLVSGKFQVYVVSFIIGLTLLLSLQANVINWDYGVLTGVDIPWRSYKGRLVVDLAVWTIGLAGFIVFARKIKPFFTMIIAVVLIAQLGTTIKAKSRIKERPSYQQFTVLDDYKYDFSTDKNIVILVLDSFQNDVFQEILDSHPKYNNLFSGFTYFRNTTAQYSKTYGAIPAMLTGNWYENHEPIQDYLKHAFANSVTTKLKQQGWRVELYPSVPRIIGYSSLYADNIVQRVSKKEMYAETGKYLDTAFFVGSPHFIKPFWYNRADGQLRRILPHICTLDQFNENKDGVGKTSKQKRLFHPILQFLKGLEDEISLQSKRPTIKYLHFNIPHEPFALNEELQQERLPSTRQGFVRHSIAGLEATLKFLNILREKGVYDNTVVFIVGDHGGGEYRTGIYEKEGIGVDSGQISAAHHESGMPLLLAKPLNGGGELRISDEPVSLGDVEATIAAITNNKRQGIGINIFDIPAELTRTRRYLFYSFAGWTQDYLPEMTEYEINGHAWSADSWKPTGRIFRPPVEENSELQSQINTPLRGREYDFKGNDPLGILGNGWSTVEDEGVWSCEKRATIKLKLPDGLKSAVYSFRLRPATRRDALSQNVEVFDAHGRMVAQWDVYREAWYSFVVYGGTPEAIATFTLSIPNAQSPLDAGFSLDSRMLGLFLRSVKIADVPILKSGEEINMALGGNSDSFLLDGWGDAEKEHRWSVGQRASLGMTLDNAFNNGFTIKILARPLLASGRETQQVTVRINGVEYGKWAMSNGLDWHTLHVSELPQSDHGAINLELHIESPVRPCDISASPDKRKLGIAVRKIEFVAN